MKRKTILSWTAGVLGLVGVSVAGFVGILAYRLSPDIELQSVAPDITLTDVAGGERVLSAFRGDYVLLDFWAST